MLMLAAVRNARGVVTKGLCAEMSTVVDERIMF